MAGETNGNGDAQARPNHALTAALIGGAAAATVGAVWSARAIARRNGRPLNPVMEAAATACELAHSPSANPAKHADLADPTGSG